MDVLGRLLVVAEGQRPIGAIRLVDPDGSDRPLPPDRREQGFFEGVPIAHRGAGLDGAPGPSVEAREVIEVRSRELERLLGAQPRLATASDDQEQRGQSRDAL